MLLVSIWIIWPVIIGAAFIPTPHKIVDKMLEIAEVKEDDILYDLGSGDGRIILEAAKTHGAKSIGIEVDPIRVLWSRLRIRSNNLVGKVKVHWRNFFRTDLSNATVVTIYQGQHINNKLISKFEKELSPGTRIVSYSFTFDGWDAVKKDIDSNVYLYII
jgi:cyclopropane fatty-acyl-phospholipid synthase-like methyltransferase